jgi:AcrR family transcriptional regulator
MTQKAAGRHVGRPAGSSTARQDILDSAVHLFAEQGVARTSLRSVTDAAGVDVALVKHYFGNKQGLFDAAVVQHSDKGFALLDELQGENPDSRTIADAYLRIWESEPTADMIRAMFRAALESEDNRQRLQQVLSARLSTTVSPEATPGASRLQLLAAHLMGVGVMRYLLKFEPLANLSHEAMVDDLAPLIESYLQ